MPELPEVETMVRGIRPAVVGRRIDGVTLCPCACRPLTIRPHWPQLQRRLLGQTIAEVRRIAKRVVLVLANDAAVVFEPRMTGLVLLADPPSTEHLRVQFDLRRGRSKSRLWIWDRRGLGTLTLFAPSEWQAALGPDNLGPDALDCTADTWRNICAAARRPIKPLMLDQKRVAGIGNLYASEILHRAKIHPEQPADSLSARQITRLADMTREVLLEAIAYEGSTLGDGTYRNALNQDGGYQNKHRVYAREGEPCRQCSRGRIRRIVQSQRATFFCPVCQRRR